jgi:hypothetical protein
MKVRLGGGQAGYGDSTEPVADLVAAGIDYLVCDALAESTLAVLQKDRQRDPALGYARDLPEYVSVAAPAIASGGMRFITNAGGLNPASAAKAAARALAEAGLSGVKIATVYGDDVSAEAAVFGIDSQPLLANVYLGARPVADALGAGAQIVITGRVADASLFLGPLVHEFGWSWTDYDLMAAGVTIGHLLECSAQVSGSVYSGPWWLDPDPLRPGYPIAEVDQTGRAVICKPPGTGGQVSFDTVREQLMYEVHDPAAYLNPDCIADFTALEVRDLGHDRVEVGGARGTAPPATYKGLYCQPAGWMGDFVHTFSWPDAEAKARMALRVVRERAERRGIAVREWCEEYFGAGAHHGYAANEDLEAARKAGWEPPEVVARLAWRCDDRAAAAEVGRRGGGLALPMASPLGRPKRRDPSQLLSLHAFSADRELTDSRVRIEVISC